MNTFKQNILEAIKELEPDAYSVPIAEYIEEKTNRQVAGGTLFVALGQLEEANHIYSKKLLPEQGKKQKRYYFLTNAGRTVLLDCIDSSGNLELAGA